MSQTKILRNKLKFERDFFKYLVELTLQKFLYYSETSLSWLIDLCEHEVFVNCVDRSRSPKELL